MTNTTGNDQLRRPVVPEDLFALRFVMGADLSPDGKSVVYALSRTDLDANTDHTDLFVLDVASGERRRLTHTNAVHARSSPRRGRTAGRRWGRPTFAGQA